MIDLPTLAGRTAADLDGLVAEVDGRATALWALDQLLCTSKVRRMLTDSRGVVIDASAATSLFTETQRQLIAARDRHCVFPGCRMPPGHCDVHHRHARADGGDRSLDNGVLLCRRHHTLLHRDDWTLRRPDDGGRWVAVAPDGRILVDGPRPVTVAV